MTWEDLYLFLDVALFAKSPLAYNANRKDSFEQIQEEDVTHLAEYSYYSISQSYEKNVLWFCEP